RVRRPRCTAGTGDESRRPDALRPEPGERRPALARAGGGDGASCARPDGGPAPPRGGRARTLEETPLPQPMPIEVTMPKLSDTMEEGKILRWLKHEGDAVAIGDILAEVETDKANMELEAYDEGTLAELKVPEGASAPVGAVIALLAAGEKKGAVAKPSVRRAPDEKEVPAARAPEAEREAKRPTIVRRPEPAEPPGARDGEPVRASPLARKIAREHDLDLGALRGTGPGGRIVEKDVNAALGGHEREGGAEPARRPAPSETRPAARGRIELSRIRR